MVAKSGDPVLPGDVVTDLESVRGITVIGPGLHRNNEPNSLLVTRPGILSFKSPNIYWIECKQKRYLQKKGDLVVGVVSKRAGELLKIDIGSSELASLSSFAFEGATKKQKPELQMGDVIYAKVLTAYREMEPELVCVDSDGKAGKMGPLANDGFVANINLNLAQRLLDIENPLLKTLGKKYVFEIVIGLNGRVWINAKNYKDVLSVLNAILSVEHSNDKELIEFCRRY